jgi:hypothetical protein
VGSLSEARASVKHEARDGSLSLETRFRGPLVAQTSAGRLAQPCGAESAAGQKVPANARVQRRSSSGVVVPDSACHAGGRGFESRRSRPSKCLQTGTFCCPIRRLNRARGPIPWPKRIDQTSCKMRHSTPVVVSGRTIQNGSRPSTGVAREQSVLRTAYAHRVHSDDWDAQLNLAAGGAFAACARDSSVCGKTR